MSDFVSRECASKEYGFSYIHSTNRGDQYSASHIDKNLFSVFMLLDGELDYVIEGNRLHIRPNDIVLVSNNELHHSIIKDGCECNFILLMIDLDFFIKNNCTDFADMVFHRVQGTDNVIPADRLKGSRIYDIFNRLDTYIGEEPVCLPVVKSVIIELLYNLNKQVSAPHKSIYQQKNIKQIIEYINDHLTDDLSLDVIAGTFFLTKQHLCKTFKKHTGFTINKYISYKRIVLVRELYSNGFSLSEACEQAGFSNYSCFYRAYSNIMNEPPRKSLSKINS